MLCVFGLRGIIFIGGSMTDIDKVARQIQIGEWCFEIKVARALRTDKYGNPYSAIANCNIHGNTMYIDGLMTKEGDVFSKEDFMTFYKFAEALGLSSFSYHRFHNGESSIKTVAIKEGGPLFVEPEDQQIEQVDDLLTLPSRNNDLPTSKIHEITLGHNFRKTRFKAAK